MTEFHLDLQLLLQMVVVTSYKGVQCCCVLSITVSVACAAVDVARTLALASFDGKSIRGNQNLEQLKMLY